MDWLLKDASETRARGVSQGPFPAAWRTLWCRAATSQHSHLSCSVLLLCSQCEEENSAGSLECSTISPILKSLSLEPIHPSAPTLNAQQTPWQQWPDRPAVCVAPQGLQTHRWIYPNKCTMISAFIAQTSYKEWNKSIVIKRQYSHQKCPCLAVVYFSPTAKVTKDLTGSELCPAAFLPPSPTVSTSKVSLAKYI